MRGGECGTCGNAGAIAIPDPGDPENYYVNVRCPECFPVPGAAERAFIREFLQRADNIICRIKGGSRMDKGIAQDIVADLQQKARNLLE
jgi:hypothetical protein